MLRKNALLSLLLFIVLIFTSACGSSGSGNCDFFGYPNTLGKITLSKTKFTIGVGYQDKVTVYVDGVDKTEEAVFTTIQENFKKDTVATVEKGLITAVKPGDIKINVHVENTEADVTFDVTVNNLPNLQIQNLEIGKNELNFELGDKTNIENLIVTLNGQDKTSEATFTSSDPSVATIDENGHINVIGEGTTTIIIHVDGANDIELKINVTLPELETAKDNFDLEIGDSEDLEVKLRGENVTSKATYTSSDPSIVTVDENGNMVAVAEGTAEITVKVDGAKDKKIPVNVSLPHIDFAKNEYSIELGQSDSLNPKVRGEDKTSEATYTSSDPSIVTVDENGNITAVGEGTAEITVKIDGAKEAKVPVTVPHQKATLSKDSFNIMLGNTEIPPTVTLRGEAVNCQFASSNENIVTIDENGNIKAVGVGETTVTTKCNGDNISIKIKVYDTLATTATNSAGQNITVNTKVLGGEEADNMKIILRDTGMIDNESAVQNVVQIDKTDNVGDVTIDIDAEDGTKVAVISKNQDGSIDYVSTETVQDKKITISSVSDKNIHEVATTNEDGTLEMVETAGFYDANNKLIASWDEVVSWGWDYTIVCNALNWGTSDKKAHMLYSIVNNNHTNLLNTVKVVFKEDIPEVGGDLFYKGSESESLLNKCETIVLPNSLETPANTILCYTNPQIKNINIRVDNPYFKSVEGIVYSKEMDILNCVPPQRQKLIIPNSVTEISNSTFANSIATSFGPTGSGADVEIPNTVTEIGNSAFAHSKAIYIQLPESVTTIHSAYPFIYCYSLKSIYLPQNLQTIIQEYASTGPKLYLLYESNGAHVYIGSSSRPSGWQSDWQSQSSGNSVSWGTTTAQYEAIRNSY